MQAAGIDTVRVIHCSTPMSVRQITEPAQQAGKVDAGADTNSSLLAGFGVTTCSSPTVYAW